MDKKLTRKLYVEFIMTTIKRISKRFDVTLNSEAEIKTLISFADEHLTDSHQISDLIETIVKIISFREREK